MPLPPSLATKTVHGHCLKGDGTPDEGSVTYTSDALLRIPDANVFVRPSSYAASFSPATNGEYSIPGVVVSNDPDALGGPFAYTETIVFSDGRLNQRTVFIDVAAPDPVEAADI